MLHRFSAHYVRYAAHVAAYLTFAANPYPGFAGRPGSYPIDVEIDPPARQNRWTTGFRLVLALPALLLGALLGFGSSTGGSGGTQAGGVSAAVALLGWFACLARGRMPQGLRDLVAYAIGYSAQVSGYLLFLTDRYPNSDPTVYESANAYRSDPVEVVSADDDLRRSRLTAFFRILLAVPHFVWLALWSIAALFAWIAIWFATLFSGRPPKPLHAFLARYLRYQVHVLSFVQLVANPFPGFAGTAGSYPVDVELDAPERQNRWVTGFRIFLAIPAAIVLSALSAAAYAAALFSWFHAVVRGQVPRGLRNLGAFELRYYAQTAAYWYLLTDRYPYSGPTRGGQLRLGTPAPAS
jgi:hypothetical protein